jgi:hypothetical protein
MGVVIFRSPWLIFRETGNGLYLDPTDEGVAEARELLDGREARRRGILSDEADMLEWAIGNGWDRVPPEDIGALTDATIISRDGFIACDGKWYPDPVLTEAKPGKVFAHMNYMVEDPIETWASGGSVYYVKAEAFVLPKMKSKVRELLRESTE